MTIEGKNLDVRLNLESTGSLSPGQTATVPISFLDLEYAKPYCVVGRKFSLREINVIGDGVIDEICFR
jgi:hypothetical protein